MAMELDATTASLLELGTVCGGLADDDVGAASELDEGRAMLLGGEEEEAVTEIGLLDEMAVSVAEELDGRATA